MAKAIEHRNIEDWQKIFEKIYSERNEIYNPEKIWARLIEETAELTKPLIREHYEEYAQALPDIFAWLVAYCIKVEINLQEAVWNRYQKGCPRCGQVKDCTEILQTFFSLGKRKEKPLVPEKGLPEFFSPFKEEPKTLTEWQDLFDRLYGKTNLELPTEYLLAKLTEDIGDMAKSIRKKEAREVQTKKIADVFAWIMGICNRFTTGNRLLLNELLVRKYPNSCHKCEEIPCKCIAFKEIYIDISGDAIDEFNAIKDIIDQTEYTLMSRENLENNSYISKESIQKIKEADVAFVVIRRIGIASYAEFAFLREHVQNRLIYIFLNKQVALESTIYYKKIYGQFENMLNFFYYDDSDDLTQKVQKIIHEIETNYKIIS